MQRPERVNRVISNTPGGLALQAGGSKLKPNGPKREVKEGELPENTGCTVKKSAAKLTLKLNAVGATGVEGLTNPDNGTLTVRAAGGRQYTMPKRPGGGARRTRRRRNRYYVLRGEMYQAGAGAGI